MLLGSHGETTIGSMAISFVPRHDTSLISFILVMSTLSLATQIRKKNEGS